MATGGLDLDVVSGKIERQPCSLRSLISEHDGGRAGVDHHRCIDAIDLGAEREFAVMRAGDMDVALLPRRILVERRADEVLHMVERRRLCGKRCPCGGYEQSEDEREACHV